MLTKKRLRVSAHLNPLQIKTQVRNLGVILDSELNFNSHINSIAQSACHLLKKLARIREFMPKQGLEKVYSCIYLQQIGLLKWLIYRPIKKTICQLQLIQNAAAGVLTKTREFDYIMPIRRFLHSSPIKQRIHLKALLLVYKSLNGLGSSYMSPICSCFTTPQRPVI